MAFNAEYLCYLIGDADIIHNKGEYFSKLDYSRLEMLAGMIFVRTSLKRKFDIPASLD